MKKYEILTLVGVALIFIAIMLFGVVHGSNSTNSTNEMLFGDDWNCGYINTTTTLESLRDCFRD